VITDAPDGAIVTIRAIPRAGRSTIAGARDGSLLVRLAAPPVEGAANSELIDLLARALDLPKRQILLISGDTSRSKRVKVVGLTAAQVRARLGVPEDEG
jgi:uncharacterized protein (TIGR00251 family)